MTQYPSTPYVLVRGQAGIELREPTAPEQIERNIGPSLPRVHG